MSSPALPGIFGAMAPVLNHYGYYAVGFLVTIEDFGVPVPGETVLIAASLYAGAGRMNVVAVGIVGVLAAIIGDNIGFLIGHTGGRTLALRFGKYVFLTPDRLDKAEAFFGQHGGKIIVLARFIEGLRQANGIVAGISGMHWRRFVAFNALGAALWVGVWVSLGYLAGNHIVAIYNQLTRYSIYVLIALAVVVAGLIGWHLRRRAIRRSRRAAQATQSPSDDAKAGTAAADTVSAAGTTPTPDQAKAAPRAAETAGTADAAGTAPGAAVAPEAGALPLGRVPDTSSSEIESGDPATTMKNAVAGGEPAADPNHRPPAEPEPAPSPEDTGQAKPEQITGAANGAEPERGHEPAHVPDGAPRTEDTGPTEQPRDRPPDDPAPS